MNLIEILINNFKEFLKISLSLILLIVISFLLIFYNFKSNLIEIKNFDLEVHGNFSYVVFNRINKPVYQNYKSQKIYLKKNKYNTENFRTYSLFYLDNEINKKHIDKWKLNLKNNFQEEMDSKLLREFHVRGISLPTMNREDLVEMKFKLNQEITKQNELIEEIENQLILDKKNEIKKKEFDNLISMKADYIFQINQINNYLNSKLIFKEEENNKTFENKIYTSIFLIITLLLFYFFANLYLFTFSKKSK
tara:strand:- start:408 stop:1157 length:750 start_codon:yes stop_codon:yes gene_type:complete